MRFRAEQHLRRGADIRRVREVGRRYDCGGFTLGWFLRPADESVAPQGARPRLGVVASRVAVGNAVQRNRAKRRLREVFRHHQHRLPPDVDVLLIARRTLNQLEYREIERKFVAACARLFPVTASDA